MNKSDFKNGMHVKLRDGSLREYYKGYFIGVEYKEHSYIDFYDIDLKNNQNDRLDIVKVFNENNNTIWKREEIDWSKVPVGTKVLVSDNENNWYEHLFIDYEINLNDEIIKFKAIDIKSKQIHSWKYCKLAEEPKEEVTSDDIGKEMKSYCKKHNKSCDRICEICTVRYILDNYNITRKDNK